MGSCRTETLGIPLTRHASASTDHNVPLSLRHSVNHAWRGGVEGITTLLTNGGRRKKLKAPQLVALTALLLAGVDGLTEPTLPARLIVSDRQKRRQSRVTMPFLFEAIPDYCAVRPQAVAGTAPFEVSDSKVLQVFGFPEL